MHFVELCSYIIPNVFSNDVQTRSSLLKVTESFIWSPTATSSAYQRCSQVDEQELG